MNQSRPVNRILGRRHEETPRRRVHRRFLPEILQSPAVEVIANIGAHVFRQAAPIGSMINAGTFRSLVTNTIHIGGQHSARALIRVRRPIALYSGDFQVSMSKSAALAAGSPATSARLARSRPKPGIFV